MRRHWTIVCTPLAFPGETVLNSSNNKTQQAPLQTQESNQPIPESLRQTLARLDQKRAAFAGLAADVAESLNDRLRVELTCASNTLEGNTLSLRETQLIEEGLGPAQDKTWREVNEAINHFAALKQVEQWVAEGRGITARTLLSLHLIVMGRVKPPGGGGLRNVSAGAPHTSESAAHVAKRLTELMEWTDPDKLHPVLFAATMLGRFESLLPFFDGNGRTGRLLLNWQLLRAGFPLAVIQVEERARYLGALDQGHAGQLIDLQTLVAVAVERSLELAGGRG